MTSGLQLIRFSAGNGRQVLVDIEPDRLIDEMHATIGHREIAAAGMSATEVHIIV